MVGTTSQGLDHTFHFESEEDGVELVDRNVGLDADDVQLQVVGILKQTDDLLFLR